MTIMYLNPKSETLFPKMTNQHFQFNGKINNINISTLDEQDKAIE